MKPYKEIASVTELSSEEYCKDYLGKSIPVVIRGGAKNMSAFRNWTADYLKFVIGSKVVDISQSTSGVFNYHKKEVKILHMPFDEAVDYLNKNNSVYIQMASIAKDYPEILGDIEEPQWMEKTDVMKKTNFWFGGGGCVSPLHFDNYQNFLVQIMGRKELTLFSPEDTKYLYSNTKGEHNLSQISLIDLEHPDENEFPLLKEAQGYKVVLGPGDILYIPLNWWHHVKTLDLSISINFWFSRFEFVDGYGYDSESTENLKNTVKAFLDCGVNIDHRNYEGETNLLIACDKGHLNIVKALLEMGANPEIKSKKNEGLNASELAAKRGYSEIVKLFQETSINK
ncbi:MAG TPA: cupin-like domain-containing protein [Ignavibacteria bacterium]|nr:cupin-like domain-containing protein [Ignavibacteria bacterium]